MVQRNLVLIPLCCGGSELKRLRRLWVGLGAVGALALAWFGCWGWGLLFVTRVCVLVGWFLLAVTGVFV
jgi:hypothetical protein